MTRSLYARLEALNDNLFDIHVVGGRDMLVVLLSRSSLQSG